MNQSAEEAEGHRDPRGNRRPQLGRGLDVDCTAANLAGAAGMREQRSPRGKSERWAMRRAQ